MVRYREMNFVARGRGPSRILPDPPSSVGSSDPRSARLTLDRLVRRFVLLVLTASGPSFGAILRTQARVETTVQELIDDAPASVNADDGEFTADGVDLPLSASATLTSTDLNGALVSMGQGFTEFSDPARLDQPNPEEFAHEVACYSNAESISYSVSSVANEARTVLFARQGSSSAPPGISFAGGFTRDIESRVFLSGAVVLWSMNAEASLDEVRTELAVTITRDDDVTPLFETTLTVDGDDINPSVTGPIRFERVDLSELEAFGLDDATLTVLQQVEAVGSLLVFVIPPQEHAYRYVVTADEELTLNAVLEIRVRNAPGGTGIAAVLGRPFEDLADFIERGLPGVDGETIQRSLNKATADRALGLVPSPDTTRTVSAPRLCGAGGVSMIGLILLLGLQCILKPPSHVGGEGRVRGFSDALVATVRATSDVPSLEPSSTTTTWR